MTAVVITLLFATSEAADHNSMHLLTAGEHWGSWSKDHDEYPDKIRAKADHVLDGNEALPDEAQPLLMLKENGGNARANTDAKEGTAAQLKACVKQFSPFPERGHDLRNRFIVDLAYEIGCEHDGVGTSNEQHCNNAVEGLQQLSNSELDAKCTETEAFPDLCGRCLVSKKLRGNDECGLLTQTERKDTIVSELQRVDAQTSAFPDSSKYQEMTPDALTQACTAETFTDWCAALDSCGAPVSDCATMSQEDKKNTFIYLLLNAPNLEHVRAHDPFWSSDGTEEKLQSETDVDLKSKCEGMGMSLISKSVIEEVQAKVAKERKERMEALRDRRFALIERLSK